VDSLHLHSKDERRWKSLVTPESVAREANLVRGLDPNTLSQREITAEDIIVDWSFVHFGMKDQNPVELVLWVYRVLRFKRSDTPQLLREAQAQQ